jgi:hypothetical protein
MQHSHHPTLLARSSACVLLMVFALAHASAAEEAVAQDGGLPAVHAIWLAQNVPFTYRGEKTAYTCETFKKKVHAVLVAVGVHASLIVELRCDAVLPVPQQTGRRPSPTQIRGEVENVQFGPTHISGTSSRIATRIALAAPAVANERNIREATTFDAQQQLLAKVRNEPLPTPSTIPVFPATWMSIKLHGRNSAWLEAEDCELLRQLSQQVLPPLGIKVTRKPICSGAKLARPSLDVEALIPIYATPARP